LRTLLNNVYAPITSAAGFINAELNDVGDALEQWSVSLYGPGVREKIDGGLDHLLRRLQPLRMGSRPRIALVGMGEWTAYFDCGLRGTDPVGAMSVLSQRLLCQAVAITAIPHTLDPSGVHKGRMGATQFTLFGPLKTHYINYVRTVEDVFDGNRWVFNASGTEQPFEEPEKYTERRVSDRFTSDMLERYCIALGIDAFNAEGYGTEGIFIERNIPMRPDMVTMTLPQAQEWLGIRPGTAVDLPG
jgi:hypothetical protein